MDTIGETTPGALTNALAETAGAASRLRAAFAAPPLFENVPADRVETARAQPAPSPRTYDFIAAALPVGGPPDAAGQRRNWSDIRELAARLAPGGLLAAVIEPAFAAEDWAPFTAALGAGGVHLAAVVRFAHLAAPGALAPVTLGVFMRRARDPVFVAEVGAEAPVNSLAGAIVAGTFGASLADGLPVPCAGFRGIDQILVENELKALEAQHPGYRRFRLVPDLAPPGSARPRPGMPPGGASGDAIYLPRGGARGAPQSDTARQEDETLEVPLNSPEVLPAFVALHFRSYLGRLTLLAAHRGHYAERLPEAALEDLVVPVPARTEQAMILLAHDKLLDLERALMVLRAELSLNPRSAASLVEHAEAMLNQVHRLSAAEQVLALVRAGESRTLEFKETLALDVRQGTREAYIEKMVLKNVAAFLNSQGGTLLVGVADDGRLPGLRRDLEAFFKGSRDALLRHLKNLLQRSIGETFYPLVDYTLVDVNGEPILRIDCRPSDKECFLDGAEFYVRMNPATDQLQGQKMLAYIRSRFRS